MLPKLKWISIAFALLSAIGFALLAFPVFVLLLRGIAVGGWQNLPAPEIVGSALRLSLSTSVWSLGLIVLFGTPLAYGLARSRFPGRRLVSLMIELPIVMPPAVAGLALLLTFGRRGVLGDPLSDLGITIAFTQAAVVLAQTFVAAPFYIRAAQVGFGGVPLELEDAARVDGATEPHVFWHITLPLARPALLSGLILSWARVLGEFGATILFAGSLQGVTQTMPLLVYGVFERDLNAAIWTSLLLIGIALAALLVSQIMRAFALEPVEPVLF